eukprot:symbB.v1.2.024543.t1/scaffold2330.1/size82151/5
MKWQLNEIMQMPKVQILKVNFELGVHSIVRQYSANSTPPCGERNGTSMTCTWNCAGWCAPGGDPTVCRPDFKQWPMMRALAMAFGIAAEGQWAPAVPPYALRCHALSPSREFYDEPIAFDMPAPRICSGARFLPVSFAIPKEDVVPCVPEKFTDFASLIPGTEESYIFPMTAYGEMEYKRMYREARFAVKKRRAGWETMRIYEILASGSVPYIHAADEIPDAALVFVNKTLLRAARRMVDDIGSPADSGAPILKNLDEIKYASLAAELLRHTQQRLTTEALANYVLASFGKRVSSALYVSGCFHGDYLCYVSLHGLRRVLGTKLVDYPLLEYMYSPKDVAPMQSISRSTTCPQSQCTVLSGGLGDGGAPQFAIRGWGANVPVYGGGFSYAYRLEHLERELNRSRAAINAQVSKRQFDMVIFPNAYLALGEGSREVQLLVKHVLKHYSPNEIIILDGRDPEKNDVLPPGAADLSKKGYMYFLREAPTWCAEYRRLPWQHLCRRLRSRPRERHHQCRGTHDKYTVPTDDAVDPRNYCGGSPDLLRSLLRTSRMSRLSLPRLGASLPNVRLTRKPAAPAPTDALARQLQAATERAATAPEGPEATGISSGFSVLDPTRKEVAVTKLWETWEEEEYRFLQTNATEQAQLVGKSGFADGRSSWARKIPALQVPAVQTDFSPDLRLIPPKAKGVRFVAGTEESENQAEEELIAFEGGASELN